MRILFICLDKRQLQNSFEIRTGNFFLPLQFPLAHQTYMCFFFQKYEMYISTIIAGEQYIIPRFE